MELNRCVSTERLEQAFAAQARATPGAIAIVHQAREQTYAELDRCANRLAHQLIERGVGPGSIVCVCMERTPDLIAAILAVLKAGGAYLPLDPAYPAERLSFMLNDSGASLLILNRPQHETWTSGVTVVDLDAERFATELQCEHAPKTRGDANSVAYVIYTSGSTGQPKGVMLRHSATGLIEWAKQAYTPFELSRVAATTSVCFDPFVFEMFVPLCTGGLIVLKKNTLEPFQPTERPTMLNGVPSVLAELARAKAIPNSARVINSGGERLTAVQVEALYSGSQVDRVYNHYGPTEATTCVTVYVVPRGPERDPPIGTPINGARVYVLDGDSLPVPQGSTGELYIGGPVLALGYLNRPDLTAKHFICDPFHPGGGQMYGTGDLVRWSDKGELEFIGRLDRQVKIRGVRIELEEVEGALLRIPAVRGAIVLAGMDQNGEAELVAYVETDQALTSADMRSALADWLPGFMIPSHLVVVREFPRMPSGKLDPDRLPAPERSESDRFDSGQGLSPVEVIITQAFQDLLGQAEVGRDDNFFDLGGNSLLTVRAAALLGQRLERQISPLQIFQAPSASLLASTLAEADIGASAHLIVLQPVGDQSPLFCTSDIFGQPTSHIGLARRLAPDYRVYGLRPGPLESVVIAMPNVRTLTEAYMKDMRAIQPRGPYFISGYSAGGVPAFDLACALEAEGEKVTLILIDSAVRRRSLTLGGVTSWAYRHGGAYLRQADWSDLPRKLYEALSWLPTRRKVRLKQVPNWVEPQDKQLARSQIQAEANYSFGVFGGAVVFVQCAAYGPLGDP